MIENYEPDQVDPTEGGLLPVDYPPFAEGGPRVFYRRIGGGLFRNEQHRSGHPTVLGAPNVVVFAPGEILWRTEWHRTPSSRGGFRRSTRHRDDGPAYVTYRTKGELQRERYYLDGVLTRDDGPADVIYTLRNGIDEHFYLDGIEVSAADHEGFRTAIDSGAPREWALAYAIREGV